VGTFAGADGTVTIDGTGSKLQGTGTATIGDSGTGMMAITNRGAAVVSSATLGSSGGSSGALTVDGATSLFQTTSGLVIGLNGAGTATVTGGATLNAGTTITLASSAGSSGTLNIGQGGTPGIVIGNISGGRGTAIVDFNHSDSAYIFSSVMSGTLAVDQSGSGTTIFTGVNTYSGGTTIEDGVLVAGTAFEILRTNGRRSGEFAHVNDFLNNNPNLQRIDVYAPNGVALVYLAAGPAPTPTPAPTPPIPVPTPSPTPNPRPPIIEVIPNPLPAVNPDKPLLLSFLLNVLNPTAEHLTSLFEIPFSGANSQRFNLNERMAEIQQGSRGFVSPLSR
jgi:T5SS/PEP-CTERM-associated repeat protein/autotransporter-associated beta strand protein